MPIESFLVFGVIAAIVTVTRTYFGRQAARSRTQAASCLADELNFTFSMADSYGLADLPFAFFRREGTGKARLVISGTHNGLPLQVFDYEHYPPNSRQYHSYTCAVLTIPASCPWLRLRRGGIPGIDELGEEDIKLEYDEFNRQFTVNCGVRTFAFSILDGQMMEWLVGAAGIDRLEIYGPWILLVCPPVDPSRWRELGELLDGFHAHIPPIVYAQYPPGVPQ